MSTIAFTGAMNAAVTGAIGGGAGLPALPPNIDPPITWLMREFKNTLLLPSGELTTERDSEATAVLNGQVVTFPKNALRWEIVTDDSVSPAVDRPMALIEGASENKCLQADNAQTWTPDGVSVEYGSTEKGIQSWVLSKAEFGSSLNISPVTQAGFRSDTMSGSLWVKPINADGAVFSMGIFQGTWYSQVGRILRGPGTTSDTPASFPAQFNLVVGEWTQIEISGSAFIGSVDPRLLMYPGGTGGSPVGSTIEVCAPQLEALPFASSYIPTPTIWEGRTSEGTYWDENGVLQTAPAGEPRYSYDPADLSKPPYLLVESEITNALTDSDFVGGFDYQRDGAVNIPISSDTGLGQGLRIELHNVGSPHAYAGDIRSGYFSTSDTGIFTYSYYVEFVEGATNESTRAYASEGTTISTGSRHIHGNIYRQWVTVEYPAGPTGYFRTVYKDSASWTDLVVVNVFGRQLENSGAPTSLIHNPTKFVSRASSASYIDSTGLIRYVGIDQPRYQYDAEDLSKPPYLLVESEATNTGSDSSNIDQWYITNTGVAAKPIVTKAYSTAPDGSLADRVQFSLNGGSSISDRSTIRFEASQEQDTTYTNSVWLKAASGNPVVRVSSNAVDTKLITVGSEWQRVSTTATPSAANSNLLHIEVRGTTGSSSEADVLVWGAQTEVGTQATSYIPTTDSAETRAADVTTSDTNTRAADTTSSNTVVRAADSIYASAIDNMPAGTYDTPMTVFNRVVHLGRTSGTQGSYRVSGEQFRFFRTMIEPTGTSAVRWGTTNVDTGTARLSPASMANTYNGAGVSQGYYDGLYAHQATGVSAPTGMMENIIIGKGAFDTEQLYGHLSDFMVFDYALTAQQIADLHNNL